MPPDQSNKGDRHENEAKDIHKRIYGAGVEKVDTFTNHDPFGFVDLIAMQKGKPIKFIQVKTNAFTKKDKQKYKKKTRHLPRENSTFEVWVRIDHVGWEIYSFDGEKFNEVAKIDTCNTSKAREQYAKLVEKDTLA